VASICNESERRRDRDPKIRYRNQPTAIIAGHSSLKISLELEKANKDNPIPNPHTGLITTTTRWPTPSPESRKREASCSVGCFEDQRVRYRRR